MTTTISTRVISYFFLFDFYHARGSSDEQDLFPESIIYFYPPREDIKRQKLLDCGEIIGLIQYLKFDLFSCIPREFNYKKSLVICEHFGRHCAFLVLSKDRFTTDEANVHLTHVLQLFNILYGTLNHIQSIYPDINQMHGYLNQTLTPILEYVFNENRSIRNLFSAIDYAPLKKNNQRCLLHVKHFLSHLQSTYNIQNGFFAYEKRILYSTCDIDTTFYIQVILGLERNLPPNEIYIQLGSEMKLRSGVELLRIYIRRPPSLEPTLNAVNANTEQRSSRRTTASPINISPSIFSQDIEPSSIKFSTNSLVYSISTNSNRHYNSVIQEDTAGSSEDTAGCETDQAGDNSPACKTETETESVASSVNDKKSHQTSSRDESISTILHSSNSQSLTDDQKTVYRYVRNRTGTLNFDFEESLKPDQKRSGSYASLDNVIFVQMKRDEDDNDGDSCDDCCPENTIDLPPVSLHMNINRTRQRTITNLSEMYDVENSSGSNDHHEGNAKFGDAPDRNDEIECDEFVLYVQRNSRMLFAGIIEKDLLTEDYLQKLWCSILTGMADMDRDIQVIPIAGETSKHNTDIKFEFNDNTHQVQYKQVTDGNPSYYKTPSSECSCLAFSAREKMNKNPGRQMTGLWRGNNLVTINQYLPHRVSFFCQRFQQQH